MTNSTLNLRKPSPAANDNDTSESNDKRCRKAPKFYAPPLNSLRQAWYQLPEIPGRCALAQPKMLKATLNSCTQILFRTTAKNCNHATRRRMTSISHSLPLTVPVQSELMTLMETCSIPQKILVQRQFKLLIGLINSLINYQRTKRSCKKIFQPVQSKKYIWSSWPEDDKSQKSRAPSTEIQTPAWWINKNSQKCGGVLMNSLPESSVYNFNSVEYACTFLEHRDLIHL